MHRRGDELPKGILLGGLIALGLLTALVIGAAVLIFASGGSSTTIELPDLPPVSTVEGQVENPVPTVSDFYPEDSNLSDCIGLVEKPGCGSKARGGWRQTAVLGVILVGLTVVFGNVIRGVRKNRAALDAATAARESAPPKS